MVANLKLLLWQNLNVQKWPEAIIPYGHRSVLIS